MCDIRSASLTIDRREVLRRIAAMGGAALWPWPILGQPGTKTILILLGTGGWPRPRKNTSASAQVIIANDTAYVVDCGDGVARQLAFAEVPLPKLRHIFITHQHSDHNADYGNLILLAWTVRPAHEGRHVGTASARKDDQALLRDERV